MTDDDVDLENMDLEHRLRAMLAARVAHVHPSIDPVELRGKASAAPDRLHRRYLPAVAATVVLLVVASVALMSARHPHRTVQPGRATVSSTAPAPSSLPATPTPRATTTSTPRPSVICEVVPTSGEAIPPNASAPISGSFPTASPPNSAPCTLHVAPPTSPTAGAAAIPTTARASGP